MRRRHLASLLGGAILVPPGAAPAGAQSPGGCRTEGPVDCAALDRMAVRLMGPDVNIHAVLVSRGGALQFERYFSGPDEVQSRRVRDVVFGPETLHDMKSVSKSIASLAVGVAVDRGLIRSLDQPVFDFFPELSDLRSPEKDRLRLSHVLTMSLGLRWVEAEPATEGDNDEVRMRRAADPCRYVLGLPVTGPPGQAFFYNTGALALLSEIMLRTTGRPLDDFVGEAVFAPLGIAGTEWRRFKGHVDAGGGLRLRPRDMLKIGQLVLAGGDWNGRRIVSREWIEASTAPRLETGDNQSYGYLWWLGHAPFRGRQIRWIGALGRGGQSIRIVPELDLVVAVTAGYYQDYSRRAFRVQYGVFRDVLDAQRAA